MNAIIDHLKTRRSLPPQQLSEPAPDAAQLETLLGIASRVPDHGRLTPWRFIVIAGDARTRIGGTIAAAYRADNPDASEDKVAAEGGRLARAPLVVAVVSKAGPHPKIPEWEQVLSAGAVCTSLIVAATGMGFGATWLTEWFAFDRRVLDALGLAPSERIAGFIHIGTPQSAPTERPRPALADIVTHL